MGNAVEVESHFPLQPIVLIIDVVSDAADAVEIVTGDLRIAVSQSFDNLFVGQPDSGFLILLFSHLVTKLIKKLLGA